jgi:hypothetical protein
MAVSGKGAARQPAPSRRFARIMGAELAGASFPGAGA